MKQSVPEHLQKRGTTSTVFTTIQKLLPLASNVRPGPSLRSVDSPPSALGRGEKPNTPKSMGPRPAPVMCRKARPSAIVGLGAGGEAGGTNVNVLASFREADVTTHQSRAGPDPSMR